MLRRRAHASRLYAGHANLLYLSRLQKMTAISRDDDMPLRDSDLIRLDERFLEFILVAITFL
jgi:hypothetical protein